MITVWFHLFTEGIHTFTDDFPGFMEGIHIFKVDIPGFMEGVHVSDDEVYRVIHADAEGNRRFQMVWAGDKDDGNNTARWVRLVLIP